jgi:hypothetical protein
MAKAHHRVSSGNRDAADRRNSSLHGGFSKAPASATRYLFRASSCHRMSLAAFITNIAESDFRYTQLRLEIPPMLLARANEVIE